jgi:dihydroxyacetone kinase phosphotransfer subunit
MVNLVIVSHCAKLAEGVKELAESMTAIGDSTDVQIAAVGGILADDGSYRLGTDALRICEAINLVWDEDGVLLLVDLGSAVLSAQLALDLLPEEIKESCLISNAPLVEGALVAALEASVGHSLEAVNKAAEDAGAFSKVTRIEP